MDPTPTIPFTILAFLGLLTILVFVHEWGHYIVARLFGVRVEVFSIGFGKEIFGWRDKKDTHWKVSWIPLGGYVKFFGDASAVSNPAKYLKRIKPEERDQCFHFKPLWQRALIVAAGPVINLILGLLIYIAIFTAQGTPSEDPVIGQMDATGPAAMAGLESGDRIIEVNGKQIEFFSDMKAEIAPNPGQEIDMVVKRGDETFPVSLMPKPTPIPQEDGSEVIEGRIGIFSTTKPDLAYGLEVGPRFTGYIIKQFFIVLGNVFKGEVSMDDLGGPVKIAEISGQEAAKGMLEYVWLIALISVNLGLINLLPIPLLDGGHLLFYSIEAVKGRPLSVKAQEMAAMIGLAFILGMLFVVTWNDLKLPGLG